MRIFMSKIFEIFFWLSFGDAIAHQNTNFAILMLLCGLMSSSVSLMKDYQK